MGLSIGIGVSLLVVFFFDTRMGRGFTPWLLYAIPVALTYWTSRHYAPLIVAAVSSGLTVAGFFLSPPLIPEYIALTNRAIGIVLFWALACLVVAYQFLARRLSQLTIDLKQALTERTQDLGRAVNALRVTSAHGAQSELHGPMTTDQLKRDVAAVLITESRRLHEQAGFLMQEQVTAQEGENGLDQTRQELERLSRQLEQLQRELLHR